MLRPMKLVAGIATVMALASACTADLPRAGSTALSGVAALSAPDLPSMEQLHRKYGQLPLAFERNAGQTDARVAFLSRGLGYNLFLTGSEAVLSLKGDGAASVLRMSLDGANPQPAISAHDRQQGNSQYFRGADPQGWNRDVDRYGKVRYAAVYPGVDLVYYGNQQRLEYDFIVAPGADPAPIVVRFEGSRQRHVDAAGNLVLEVDGKPLVQKRPVAYQQIDGQRRAVQASYKLLADNRVGFALGDYDRRHALVVDPILEYVGVLDGSLHDWGYSIAVDRVGNTYLAGTTQSTDFPVTNPNRQPSNEAFVSKINATGDALYYSVYLGGSQDDEGRAIAVDAAGNAYFAGYTRSTNFPTVNAIQAINNGYDDAFVSKLNATGTALVYSTLLGGASFDDAASIAVDAAGNAYVAGTTQSANFPVQAARQPASGGGGYRDAFVSKLNAAGNALVYSTYHGGSTSDYGYDIAVDAAGNAYLTGETDSVNFPVVAARQAAKAPFVDAYVSKFSANGSALVYSTYLGGDSYDRGYSIAVDGAGSAHVTGETDSNDFPVQAAIQAIPGQVTTKDAFVTKYTPAGNAFVYSTYLGGSGHEYGYGIAIDLSGNAYVAGETKSSNFPVVGATQPAASGDSNDAFVSKLPAAGTSLIWSTYLGSNTEWEHIRDLALDAAGNVYLAGYDEDVSNSFMTSAVVAKVALPTSRSWRGDFNGDGKSDMLLRNANTGGNLAWLSANSATPQAVATAPHPWAIAGVGDFDGNGTSDVLWRNLASGANTIWRAANPATQTVVGTLNPQDWAVAGIGDFNGDGKGDILWPSGNAVAAVAMTRVADMAWEIVGVGNFDGDTRADVLWRHNGNGRNTIWRSADAASQQTTTTVPGTLWRVAACGDFDGDGKSDILWRNHAYGTNTIWRSGNSATVQAVSAVAAGTGWYLAGAGNYDGDTRADLLWRNTITGANTVWKGGNSATRQTVTSVANPDWSIKS